MTDGTLFAGTDWKDTRDTRTLENIILDAVRQRPRKSRLDLWLDIVQTAFMRFTRSEYNQAVAKLVKDKKVAFEDVRGTGRLNDDARLYLTGGESR